MLPEAIEKIIDCYVDDLVLIDEYCNVGHTNRMNQMNKCNTLAEYEVDRLYHPLVEDEIFRLMVHTISGRYKDITYYIKRLAMKAHDLACETKHLRGFEKYHKWKQCEYVFNYGRDMMPPDFDTICKFFFNVPAVGYIYIHPGTSGMSILTPIAYFCLNDNPNVSPNQVASNHFKRVTYTPQM